MICILFAVIFALIVSLIAVIICFSFESKEDLIKNGTQNIQINPENQVKNNGTSQSNAVPVGDEDITIEEKVNYETEVFITTPFGEIYFPGIWGDNLRIEEKEENGIYSAKFFGKCGNAEKMLFVVYVGDTAEGHKFGTVYGKSA